MREDELRGEERAREADAKLAETLSLLQEANQEVAKFRRYLHDNHWADKARTLWTRTL